MADSPHDANRPPGQPKYLPRIQYKPPEPEDEESADEATAGASLDSAVPPKKKDKAATGNPPRAGRVEPVAPAPVARPTLPGKVESGRPKANKDADVAKARAKEKPKEKTGSLIEETPEGETFDARRRARLAVGAVATCALLLSMIVLYRSLRSDSPDFDLEPLPGPQAVEAKPKARPSPAAQEARAKKFIAEARKLERDGKLDEALKRVERVAAEFAETPSAKLANDARERHRQGLPLFVAGAAVIATKAEPREPDTEPVADEPAPAAEVIAVRPEVAAVPPGRAAIEVAPAAGTAPAGAALREPRRVTGVGLAASNVPARPLPSGFHAREDAGVHASGWPLEITGDLDGASMVLIPGDVFIQGRDDGKPEERPAHKVRLPSYYIDQHEVTGRQFALFRAGGTANDLPVVNVSRNDALAYAQWAGKSLPTEAQWEMAARTPDGRLHPWGNSRAQWDRPRQAKRIDLVMSYPSDLSPYGAFDLAGNAWEWTLDWFDTRAYAAMKGKTTVNPGGPARGRGRLPEVVVKGGSRDWDGSWRSGMRPDATLPYLGFRCVLNVEGGPAPPAAPAAPGVPRSSAGAVPF